MTSEDVLGVLSALEEHGVPYVMAGGWGVDAVLGRQTRSHDDLDVVIDNYEVEVDRAIGALAPLGFTLEAAFERRAWMPKNSILRDDAGRRVDLDSIDWQMLADAFGLAGPDEEIRKAIEHDVVGEGTVANRRVPCLSAEVQLLYHTRFELTAPHRHDVRLLRDELGASVPPRRH
jgi:lincosamide nucleotidyltransferase A/C/D/E